MHELLELGKKISPIMEIAMECRERNRQLIPISHTIHNLQMAFFWLSDAVDEFHRFSAEQEGIEEEVPMSAQDKMRQGPLKPPSIIGSREQMDYIVTKLIELDNGLKEVGSENYLPSSIRYKIDRTSDQLSEGRFNMNIAKHYYEQLNGNKPNNS